MSNIYENDEYEDFSVDNLNDQPCCDICGTPMTIEEYRKNNGFCEECARDICEE